MSLNLNAPSELKPEFSLSSYPLENEEDYEEIVLEPSDTSEESSIHNPSPTTPGANFEERIAASREIAAQTEFSAGLSTQASQQQRVISSEVADKASNDLQPPLVATPSLETASTENPSLLQGNDGLNFKTFFYKWISCCFPYQNK